MARKLSIFDKIDKFLRKRGHELVMSVFLSSYNQNNIYIRFDYIKKISVYKVVWFDLNFIDENHLENYLNVQTVTKFMAVKLTEKMTEKEYTNSYTSDDKIVGDRVEILAYFNNHKYEFLFDRFLPLELDFLVDPLVMIFTYLPRSMEVFLNEMFGKFDGLEREINSEKLIHYDFWKNDFKQLFLPAEILHGDKLYANERVTFLEKFSNNYFAIVEDRVPHLVIINDFGEDKYRLSCDCQSKTYCPHMYATLMAIKHGEFNPFYKVRYTGKDETLLEKLSYENFYFCFGIDRDDLLIVTPEAAIARFPIIQKGKCVFEVLEDDDNLSLSSLLEEYKKK